MPASISPGDGALSLKSAARTTPDPQSAQNASSTAIAGPQEVQKAPLICCAYRLRAARP